MLGFVSFNSLFASIVALGAIFVSRCGTDRIMTRRLVEPNGGAWAPPHGLLVHKGQALNHTVLTNDYARGGVGASRYVGPRRQDCRSSTLTA
jgi:hypothetical protein